MFPTAIGKPPAAGGAATGGAVGNADAGATGNEGAGADGVDATPGNTGPTDEPDAVTGNAPGGKTTELELELAATGGKPAGVDPGGASPGAAAIKKTYWHRAHLIRFPAVASARL